MEAAWIQDIDDILKADDVRQLRDDLAPFFSKVTAPNDRAEDAFNSVFDECRRIDPVRAIWVAWLLGAAWQKLADELDKD